MAMDDYEIELVLDGPGASHEPEFGAIVLEAFLEAAPEADPVVEQNIESGRIVVNLSFASESVSAAASTIFEITRAALANMSPSLALTGMHVDAVSDREPGAVLCA